MMNAERSQGSVSWKPLRGGGSGDGPEAHETAATGGAIGRTLRIPGSAVLAAAFLTATIWAQTPAAAMITPLPEAQHLEAGDLIQINVFEAPELTTVARLDAAGAITMPQAGRLKLQGETAAQAEQTVAARLRRHYLLAPEVEVRVREFAPEPVTVLGAVKEPGVYSARSFPDLESMLAAAGGVSARSGGEVVITRAGGERDRVELDKLARGGAAPKLKLAGGDLIRVMPAATVYIGGEVMKPGAYPLPASGLSLVEALSLAGGMRPNSRATQTRLVHTNSRGQVSTELVDARQILAGQAPDRRLRPFDLLYVPRSPERAVAMRTLETVVNVGTTILSGVIIFH